jgi:plastocyanin
MLFRAAIALLTGLVLLRAGDIRGTIVIKRKLTRYNVTASAGLYQRGWVAPLGQDPENDPIAFERSHVAVYIEGPRTPELGASGEVAAATIEQKDRRFVPDLVVIPVGATVSFPNLDPIFHNVFSLSGSKSFDLGNYPMGETRHVTFTRPGIVALNCHLHANMSASIVVAPNRWAVRAASDGTFVIRRVPPGTYNIVAWHRVAGTFRQRVEVAGASDSQITFVLPFTGALVGETSARR